MTLTMRPMGSDENTVDSEIYAGLVDDRHWPDDALGPPAPTD